MNAQGKYLNSVNAKDGGLAWRAEVSGAGVVENAQVFSPPALGDEFMYLSSSWLSATLLMPVRQQRRHGQASGMPTAGMRGAATRSTIRTNKRGTRKDE